MALKNNSAVKYKDIAKYSATIGAVDLCGMSLQLCDYVEAVAGQWYAIAYFTGYPEKKDGKDASGLILKTLAGEAGQNMRLAYVPEELLEQAEPRYNDEQLTQILIKRLQKELARLNNAAGRLSA